MKPKTKITKTDFAYQRQWNKHILGYRGDLGHEYSKALLLAYCFAMADKGSAGKGCYASDETIAGETGMNRRTVEKYRHEAINLGWFVKVGHRNRVDMLDICIPGWQSDSQPTEAQVGNPVTNPESKDPWDSIPASGWQSGYQPENGKLVIGEQQVGNPELPLPSVSKETPSSKVGKSESVEDSQPASARPLAVDEDIPPFYDSEDEYKTFTDPWSGETVTRTTEVIHTDPDELTGPAYSEEDDEPYREFESTAKDRPVERHRPWDDD